jgi:hypothetical protein
MGDANLAEHRRRFEAVLHELVSFTLATCREVSLLF